jgi:Transposase DDE domain group 1
MMRSKSCSPKDAKLGLSLRRLPLSDLDANRVWLACSTLALNLLARLNDLIFGPEPPGHLPRRRQAKFVRRMLLCVRARVIRHARQIILRLPAGLAAAPAFQAAYTAACGLSPPALVS